MKRIGKLVNEIDDELCSAKKYAEMYLELKMRGDSNFASKFKQMAQDELGHATILNEYSVQEINELEKYYRAPEEMEEKWKRSHNRYVERVAWIKQMLIV